MTANPNPSPSPSPNPHQVTTYLFNIIEDPHEANNVADEHPGIVAELTGMLEP